MNETLIMIIYILLIGLLIVGIILGIKLLMTVTKINQLLDDASDKLKSLDKLFDIVDMASDRMSVITESAFGFLSAFIGKLFKKSKKIKRSKEEEEDEDDE